MSLTDSPNKFDLPLQQEEREIEIEVPRGNDLAVLEAVAGKASSIDESGAVSFQGMRRKLGLHQETLSRALRRLEKDGLIQKFNHDYKISQNGERIIPSDTNASEI